MVSRGYSVKAQNFLVGNSFLNNIFYIMGKWNLVVYGRGVGVWEFRVLSDP